MAVDNFEVVDIISADPGGNVVLKASDHLDWSDSISHQRTLQEKLNRYLAFVQSGEIVEQYPEANGRPVIIEVVTKHPPDLGGLQFLERADAIVTSAGFGFRHTCITSRSESSGTTQP